MSLILSGQLLYYLSPIVLSLSSLFVFHSFACIGQAQRGLSPPYLIFFSWAAPALAQTELAHQDQVVFHPDQVISHVEHDQVHVQKAHGMAPIAVYFPLLDFRRFLL